MGQIFAAHAFSGVGNGELKFVCGILQSNAHGTALRRELTGVRKKIPNDLLKALRIQQRRPSFLRRCGTLNLNAVRLRQVLHSLYRHTQLTLKESAKLENETDR